MIEIGKTRTVPVRRRLNGKLSIVPGETRMATREVWAFTRDELGGTFGPDRERKLVVGLTAGDVIVMYPKGTRQKVSAPLKDVYRYLIHLRANRAQLEKARERKVKIAENREQRRREAAEKRLRKAARADRQTEGWVNAIRKQA